MVYTKLHLMLCISSIDGFSYSLISTVYILKKKINVSPVTIEILYSFVEHDFMISYCNAYYPIIY